MELHKPVGPWPTSDHDRKQRFIDEQQVFDSFRAVPERYVKSEGRPSDEHVVNLACMDSPERSSYTNSPIAHWQQRPI